MAWALCQDWAETAGRASPTGSCCALWTVYRILWRAGVGRAHKQTQWAEPAMAPPPRAMAMARAQHGPNPPLERHGAVARVFCVAHARRSHWPPGKAG